MNDGLEIRKLDLIKAGASTPANKKICDISNHSSDRHSSPLNSTSDGNSIVIENEDIPCLSASGRGISSLIRGKSALERKEVKSMVKEGEGKKK